MLVPPVVFEAARALANQARAGKARLDLGRRIEGRAQVVADAADASSEPDVPLALDAQTPETGPCWRPSDLLEYTNDVIIVWEMSGNGIVYWNRAAERLYGYSRHEAHGRSTHELLRTRLGGGVSYLEQNLTRYGVWFGELRQSTRDGREVVVEGRLALLPQENGSWLVLEVNRDITDRTVAGVARRTMERQLQKLRALRQSTPNA
jgi:PAS domain S-box-containing protein